MRKVIVLVCLLLVSLSSVVQAQLVVEITEGIKRRPIAIVPFGWEGNGDAMPGDIARIISDDLTRSGRFAPIPEEDMLQKPTTGVDVDFDDWAILGVEAVVVGRVTQTGDNAYSVQFQLFDVFGRDQLVGYRMPASRGTMRRVAHRAADMIYEKLTGIAGVFDTKISYVTSEDRRDGRLFSLIVADQDGFNEHKIMESTDPIMSPAWSPDSRRLAYVSFEGDRSSIFIQTLRTGNRVQVSSRAGVNGAPAFSPDGRKLVVTLSDADGNLDIYTLDINSRQTRRITTHRAIDTEGSWSPDGSYIYFTSDRSGGPQIYRVSAAFTRRRKARHGASRQRQLSYCRDGREAQGRFGTLGWKSGRVTEFCAKQRHIDIRDKTGAQRRSGECDCGWPDSAAIGIRRRRCQGAGLVAVSAVLR